jgi:DNA-binding MarR family transcriptional regulator
VPVKNVEQGPCSCTALRKATRKVSQLYDEALAPCGLRTTQRAILNHIKRAGTPGMGELAEALVMDRGALAHNLKPLERDGFLRVKVDPNDRRNRIVALTELGKAKLAESEKYWLRAQKSFEKAFGMTKTVSLRKALAFIVSEDFTESFGHKA